MNERIKQLLDEATVYALHETKDAVDFLDNPVSKQQRELQLEKFAELIIEQCCRALNPMLRDMISRGQGQELIRQNFGIEERKGWVCPKCSIDRTKDVCPKGDSAVLTGDCPMTATAQTGVE